MRTDFIWFKVEVPEGVEITDVAGDNVVVTEFVDDKQIRSYQGYARPGGDDRALP